MNFKNLSEDLQNNSYVFYLLIVLVNLLLLFPSIKIPFFGDDFAWLLQSESGSKLSLFEFISLPAPLDYFRPLPKLFFFILSQKFNGSFFLFRLFIIALSILCSLLVYKFTLSLNYSKKISVISALIFSVLSCHSEVLFFINCVNEIFSALFILTGLYLFAKYDRPFVVPLVIFVFLLAFLSRESAICSIPLIILVKIKTGKGKWKDVILISIIPVFIYLAYRIFSETYFRGSNIGSMIDSMDLNPLKITYKLFHYFTNMLFPVKFLFELIGFNSLENLIKAFRKPLENLPLFLFLSSAIIAICSAVIFLFYKTLKKEIIFPLLFILFSLGIYIFSFNTAERFLYLPSVGICILLGMFFDILKYKKIAFLSLILFLIFHSVSLVIREFRYKESTFYSAEVMNNLFLQTDRIKNGSTIYLESIPPKKYGILFLSPYNFQDNWDYNFPERKLSFLFNETITKEDKSDAVYRFNEDVSGFEIVK